jgi:YidC/Oxa1 family membrane protein insertase
LLLRLLPQLETLLAQLEKSLGSFILQLCHLTKASNYFENELVKLTIANKGGYIVEATLKNMKNLKGSGTVSRIDQRQ